MNKFSIKTFVQKSMQSFLATLVKKYFSDFIKRIFVDFQNFQKSNFGRGKFLKFDLQ